MNKDYSSPLLASAAVRKRPIMYAERLMSFGVLSVSPFSSLCNFPTCCQPRLGIEMRVRDAGRSIGLLKSQNSSSSDEEDSKSSSISPRSCS